MSGIQENQMCVDALIVKVIIGIEKECSKCEEAKSINCFSKRKKSKDGYRNQCKKCCNKSHNVWIKNNPKKAKEIQKRYAKSNKARIMKTNRKYQKEHPEKNLANTKRYQENNPEKCRESRRTSERKRRSTGQGALNNRVHVAIYNSLRGNKHKQGWEDLVGYSCENLQKHLEKLFKQGMTWENYGQWHVDHRVPLAVHNFISPTDIDFKRAWALSNLQPLWAVDNIRKSDNLNMPFQPSLCGV